MRIGARLRDVIPSYVDTLADLPQFAADLESAGVDELVVGEHLLYSSDMPHAGGEQLGRAERSSRSSDALVLFSAIAAATSRVSLCASALVAALHHPILLARQSASLDQISRGRFALGLTAGWFEAEFAAMSVPYEERFARLEETILICRSLWQESPATFSGRWTNFVDMVCDPAPASAAGPAILVGARPSPTTVRRIVRLSDGWIASEAATFDELERGIAAIHQECRSVGRDPAQLTFRVTLPDAGGDVSSLGRRAAPIVRIESSSEIDSLAANVAASIDQLANVGVDHVALPLSTYGLERAAVRPFFDKLAALLGRGGHRSDGPGAESTIPAERF